MLLKNRPLIWRGRYILQTENNLIRIIIISNNIKGEKI
nr:MAG TPA: hypothetical protein [Caudoviricetes sp.]